MGFVANSIQEEINELVRRIYAISNHAKRDSQAAFREAAKPLISAIQSRAPVSSGPHSRYVGGSIYATYHSGNLKRSIKTLTFRRSAAVFVGPKLDKGGSGGVFRGNRTDGYYAHWLEYGTDRQPPQPFIRPAAAVAGAGALQLATKILKRKINSFANRYEQVRAR